MGHADRAKQFLPFAALSGFGGYIRDEEEIKEERPILADDEVARLNEALSAVDVGERVEISYFSCGKRTRVSGTVSAIDRVWGRIKVGESEICISDIVGVEAVSDR